MAIRDVARGKGSRQDPPGSPAAARVLLQPSPVQSSWCRYSTVPIDSDRQSVEVKLQRRPVHPSNDDGPIYHKEAPPPDRTSSNFLLRLNYNSSSSPLLQISPSTSVLSLFTTSNFSPNFKLFNSTLRPLYLFKQQHRKL